MNLEKRALILDFFQTRNPSIKDSLVLAYKPLVEYVARKLSYNRDDFDDLVQVGMMGLLRAIDHFDPSHDADFSTFATPNIIGEIKHYFRDKKNVVKIPRKLQENYSKIRNYLKEMQHTPHQPTTSDIAKHLQLTEEMVLEAMEAGQSFSVISLDMPSYSSADKSAPSDSILDALGNPHKEDSFLDSITLKEALKKLDAREQSIVHLRYYLGLSQKEVAEQIGLSQMHISRVLATIVKKLKKELS